MTEVIVYRNPLEAAMWRGLMDGSFLPVIAGIIVFFCVFLLLNKILNRGRTIGKNVARNTNIALGVGAIIGLAVMFYLAS